MTAPIAAEGTPADEELDAIREQITGTNINEKSLLATDYLNHFIEVVMLFDLIPDMPECMEEAEVWRPKSYQDHFRDSDFSDRVLAIKAYDFAPPDYRDMFEQNVDRMNKLVELSLKRIRTALDGGDGKDVRAAAERASRDLTRLNGLVSAVINGAMPTISQEEIDDLLEE